MSAGTFSPSSHTHHHLPASPQHSPAVSPLALGPTSPPHSPTLPNNTPHHRNRLLGTNSPRVSPSITFGDQPEVRSGYFDLTVPTTPEERRSSVFGSPHGWDRSAPTGTLVNQHARLPSNSISQQHLRLPSRASKRSQSSYHRESTTPLHVSSNAAPFPGLEPVQRSLLGRNRSFDTACRRPRSSSNAPSTRILFDPSTKSPHRSQHTGSHLPPAPPETKPGPETTDATADSRSEPLESFYHPRLSEGSEDHNPLDYPLNYRDNDGHQGSRGARIKAWLIREGTTVAKNLWAPGSVTWMLRCLLTFCIACIIVLISPVDQWLGPASYLLVLAAIFLCTAATIGAHLQAVFLGYLAIVLSMGYSTLGRFLAEKYNEYHLDHDNHGGRAILGVWLFVGLYVMSLVRVSHRRHFIPSILFSLPLIFTTTLDVDATSGAFSTVWVYIKPMLFGASVALVVGLGFFPVSALFVLEKQLLKAMCQVLKMLDITTKAFLLKDPTALLSSEEFNTHMSQVRQVITLVKQTMLEAKYEISYSHHQPQDFKGMQLTLTQLAQHLGSMTLSVQNEQFLIQARHYIDYYGHATNTSFSRNDGSENQYYSLNDPPLTHLMSPALSDYDLTRQSTRQNSTFPQNSGLRESALPLSSAQSVHTTHSIRSLDGRRSMAVPKEVEKADKRLFLQLLRNFSPSIYELSYLCQLTLDRCVDQYVRNCRGLAASSAMDRIVHEVPDNLLIQDQSLILSVYKHDSTENPKNWYNALFRKWHRLKSRRLERPRSASILTDSPDTVRVPVADPTPMSRYSTVSGSVAGPRSHRLSELFVPPPSSGSSQASVALPQNDRPPHPTTLPQPTNHSPTSTTHSTVPSALTSDDDVHKFIAEIQQAIARFDSLEGDTLQKLYKRAGLGRPETHSPTSSASSPSPENSLALDEPSEELFLIFFFLFSLRETALLLSNLVSQIHSLRQARQQTKRLWLRWQALGLSNWVGKIWWPWMANPPSRPLSKQPEKHRKRPFHFLSRKRGRSAHHDPQDREFGKLPAKRFRALAAQANQRQLRNPDASEQNPPLHPSSEPYEDYRELVRQVFNANVDDTESNDSGRDSDSNETSSTLDRAPDTMHRSAAMERPTSRSNPTPDSSARSGWLQIRPRFRRWLQDHVWSSALSTTHEKKETGSSDALDNDVPLSRFNTAQSEAPSIGLTSARRTPGTQGLHRRMTSMDTLSVYSQDPDVANASPWRRRWTTALYRLWQASEWIKSYKFRYAIKLSLTTTLLSFPAWFDNSMEFFTEQRMQWIAITILIVLSPTIGRTFLMSIYRIIGTVAASIFALTFWYMTGASRYGVAILSTLLAVPCFYIVLFTPHTSAGLVSLILYTLTIFTLFSQYNPYNDTILTLVYKRIWTMVTGLVAAVLINAWLWPRIARVELRHFTALGLDNLGILFSDLVAKFILHPLLNPENHFFKMYLERIHGRHHPDANPSPISTARVPPSRQASAVPSRAHIPLHLLGASTATVDQVTPRNVHPLHPSPMAPTQTNPRPSALRRPGESTVSSMASYLQRWWPTASTQTATVPEAHLASRLPPPAQTAPHLHESHAPVNPRALYIDSPYPFEQFPPPNECLEPAIHLNSRFRKLLRKTQDLLVRSQAMLEESAMEPRLRGPFPLSTYREIIRRLQNVLDRFVSMAVITNYISPRAHGSIITPFNRHGRRDMTAAVLINLYALAGALRSKSPLPPYLPSARASRARLIARIRESLNQNSGFANSSASEFALDLSNSDSPEHAHSSFVGPFTERSRHQYTPTTSQAPTMGPHDDLSRLQPSEILRRQLVSTSQAASPALGPSHSNTLHPNTKQYACHSPLAPISDPNSTKASPHSSSLLQSAPQPNNESDASDAEQGGLFMGKHPPLTPNAERKPWMPARGSQSSTGDIHRSDQGPRGEADQLGTNTERSGYIMSTFYWYAYSAALEEVIEEVEELVILVKSIVGENDVLHGLLDSYNW
ncbi:hypothetical protein H4R34_002313 [Dimargaris verticillata]|uniref:ER transporter 6TM N-terminal domain-containing protein n=1 Tax=Dimargaris verticillata TaxID=2761393 RepID=A0A9W8B925_9FUNG|nr:hypothetical protein H4R34_002313 [Dimargaris verticillata]